MESVAETNQSRLETVARPHWDGITSEGERLAHCNAMELLVQEGNSQEWIREQIYALAKSPIANAAQKACTAYWQARNRERAHKLVLRMAVQNEYLHNIMWTEMKVRGSDTECFQTWEAKLKSERLRLNAQHKRLVRETQEAYQHFMHEQKMLQTHNASQWDTGQKTTPEGDPPKQVPKQNL